MAESIVMPPWRHTIRAQRAELKAVFEGRLSVVRYPSEIFARAYAASRLRASEETGIDFTPFPEVPPLTVDQAPDEVFLPKEPNHYD